jgi:hypothetical protein
MTTRTLSCDLTQDEISAYSNELAITIQLKQETESHKKEVMSDFTAKLNKCDADAYMLSRKINNRREDRQIECDWELDYPNGKAYLIRMDTGVTIDSRKLTDEERQQRFDLEGEEDQYPDTAPTNETIIDGEILTIEHNPELAEELWRNAVCNEWKNCDYADECMENEKEKESPAACLPCLRDEAAKH